MRRTGGSLHTDAEDPEAELLARLAGGEQEAPLMQLYDRYATPVYRLGLRLLGDEGRAEELVQETFLRLWRSAGRYDRRESSVQGFVFLLARRAAIDAQRRASVRPRTTSGTDAAEAALAVSDPASEAALDQAMLGLDVRAALGALSAKHREVLELAYAGDLTQPEIAARLGLPLGTVKTRAYHGLRALRQELERRGLDD